MSFNRYSLDLELSSSQYAYCTDNAALSITGDISGEAWLKLEQLPSTAGTAFTIYHKWINAGQKAYAFQIEQTDDKLHAYYSGDGTNATSLQTTNAIVTSSDVGKWIHLAWAIDVSEKTWAVYKNGVSVGADYSSGTQTAIYNGTDDFRLGGTNYFDGLMSNVRLWSDIRSEAEIQANMYLILTGTDNNLVGSWYNDANDHNDDAGSNNLTASGSPVFSTNVPWTGANTTDWTQYHIKSDNTKVSGSSDHTDIPLLIKDGNLSTDVYDDAYYQVTQVFNTGNDAYFADKYGGNAAWATIRGASTGTTAGTYVGGELSAGNYYIYRCFSSWDTSSIPDAATITAVNLVITNGGKDTSNDFTVAITGHTGGDSTLSNDDFNNITLNSPTEYASRSANISTVSVSSTISYNFNASGIAAISKTGYTKILYRHSKDLDNSTPTARSYMAVGSPTMTVTYTCLGSEVPDVASVTSVTPLDLRFTTDSEGTTEVPSETVSIDPVAETCEIWVKYPTLSYNSDSDLYVWYGNASAVAYDANAPFGSQNVWSSAYKVVRHLGSNSNDSTSNALNGTDDSITYQAGKIGNGAGMNASGDDITSTYASFSSAMTTQFWIKSASTAGTASTTQPLGNGSTNDTMGFSWDHADSSYYRAWYMQNSSSTYVPVQYAGLSADTWYMLTAVWNGTNLRIYSNGTYVTQGAITTIKALGGNLTLRWGGTSSTTDEFRFRNDAVSDDWITTEYNNQNDPSTFWKAGGVRRYYAPGIWR